MITTDVKRKIVAEIDRVLPMYPSAAKLANKLGISSSQMSRILNGDFDKVLADTAWISLARKLEVNLFNQVEWVTAKTPVFEHIYTQLTVCQDQGLSALLCDSADIGKSYTAKCYVKEHKNAVLIDCSQCKTKQRLVRAISKEFGLSEKGRYTDVYENLTFYLRSIVTPLVILDEAGDLDYTAFLEIKALWNATEGACGWYLMGADGLRVKIESNLNRNKVGYAEIFSRLGGRFQKITPYGKDEAQDFALEQFTKVAIANGVAKESVIPMFGKTRGSLRRTAHEIKKSKTIING